MQNLFFKKITTSLKYPIKRFSFELSSNPPKRFFELRYTYVDNMLELRTPHREEHLRQLTQYLENGTLVFGGAFLPNASGALFMFEGKDERLADQFMKSDPYYRNKLVKEYTIKEVELIEKQREDELALLYKFR